MLACIEHLAGAETAGKVQLGAEYFPDGVRYGGCERDPRAPGYVRAG